VTAGYGDPVIFADGTFIDGSTAELSADGPIRPPFVVYCQVIRKCARVALLALMGQHFIWSCLVPGARCQWLLPWLLLAVEGKKRFKPGQVEHVKGEEIVLAGA